MPNIRSKNQTLIGCWCDDEFIAKIDAARGELTRSQFCRTAAFEKLVRMGIKVDQALSLAPDRTGKGGPHKITSYPRGNTEPWQANEVNSKPASGAARLVKKHKPSSGSGSASK